MIRGAVYHVDLGDHPRGHEQGGRRYGVVLSPTNFPWSVATIVPTSTSAAPGPFRPQLEVAGEPTVFLVDQVRSIDVDYIRGDRVDYLHHDDLAVVEEALSRYLGLIPE